MDYLIGYLASAFIGVTLGLVGGGGSVLTVPVLVYLFHVEPALATAYSLFIVGTTSLVGGIRNALDRSVDFRTAIVFSIPSFIAVFLTRRFLVPRIPQDLFSVGGYEISKDLGIMIFFTLIMVGAAISMIRKEKNSGKKTENKPFNYPVIILEGMVVGLVTGIVGAGGGFLIIPALVLFAGLPMKKAVGTSLIIIAVKSLVGFAGDIGAGQEINYTFIVTVSAIAIIGIFIGNYFSGFIHPQKLKVVFGWFVLAMGIFIFINETMLLHQVP